MSAHDPDLTPPPWHKALPRIVVRLVFVAGVVWLCTLFYGWAYAQIAMLEVDQQAGAMLGLLLVTALIYGVLIAIPFIPAIEIALALLVMNGASVAPLVYSATVLGLMLAFGIGRWVSLDWLQAAFRDLRMIRACRMLQRIKAQSPTERLHDLSARLPGSIRWLAIDYRYLSLALLLNIPGNVAIGGGGGIMMMAGISRLFHAGWVMGTLVLATAPVPLFVWFMGAEALL